jgi:hypothetical protein
MRIKKKKAAAKRRSDFWRELYFEKVMQYQKDWKEKK